jgi:SprB repeat
MLLIPTGRSLNSIFPGYMSALGEDRIFYHTIGKLSFLLVRLFSIFIPILLIATTAGQTFGGNALTLTLTATNVTCNGQNNGAISSVLTGGTGGTVNYTLNPGSVSNTSGVFNNLTAGTYTVSADDSGNIVTSIVIITEPATKLVSKITSQVDVRCKGNASGSVTVTGIGGTAGYTYSIDGGTTYKASGTFSALAVGSYTVRVKDASGVLWIKW